MKKFLLRVSLFALYALTISVILPIWIDPFNVFHWENIRANGVEPNKNYIKMKYILSNPDKFDSFVFGSSRVDAIHADKIQGEKCYNMTYSVGVPNWHLLNIKTLLANNIIPKRVYIGVDSIQYTADYEHHVIEPLRCPYEYLADDSWHFYSLYLNPTMVFKSIGATLDVWSGKTEPIDTEVFYKYGGGYRYGRKKIFNWNDKGKVFPSIGGLGMNNIDAELDILRKIIDVCRENGIDLVFFTNPMHKVTYLASVRKKDYFRYLEGLAEISDFWNFSSLNDITIDNSNYFDTSHYDAEVGDLIIDIMCNGKLYPKLQAQGFGVKVTRENAKDFIAMLRKQAEDFKE